MDGEAGGAIRGRGVNLGSVDAEHDGGMEARAGVRRFQDPNNGVLDPLALGEGDQARLDELRGGGMRRAPAVIDDEIHRAKVAEPADFE